MSAGLDRAGALREQHYASSLLFPPIHSLGSALLVQKPSSRSLQGRPGGPLPVVLKANARTSSRLERWDKGWDILSVILKARVAESFWKRQLPVMLTSAAKGNPWSPVRKRENLFGGTRRRRQETPCLGSGSGSESGRQGKPKP